MFLENIPEAIQARMRELEAIDERDRNDGTPQLKRLRQIPPESGNILALLAAAAPKGDVLEIGTSAGYSSLWLILACQQRAGKLTTFELLPEKVELAKQTFASAGVAAFVNQIHGDARGHLKEYDEVAFCFLDVEKEMYQECYDLVVPNLVTGGLLIVDNVVSHAEELEKFLAQAQDDQRVDAVVLPVGKGLLVVNKRKPLPVEVEETPAEEDKPAPKKKRARKSSKK
ncbi:MAG: O-methyltransferase [Chloroflexi bacterium]|nr:MAG: O-methyltransferase [Chloroflexota bacterium]MBL1192888.1 O-methyltransferase [Chloroflexota bacterium]NOH10180.1 O-methyltransferase [Chloroflexota bacterium]